MTIPYNPKSNLPSWMRNATNYAQNQQQQGGQPSGAPNWWDRLLQNVRQYGMTPAQGMHTTPAIPTGQPAQPRSNWMADFNARQFPILNIAQGASNILTPGNTAAVQRAQQGWNAATQLWGATPPEVAQQRVNEQFNNPAPAQGTPYWINAMYGQGYAGPKQPQPDQPMPDYGTGGGYGSGGYPSYPDYPAGTAPTPSVDKWLYGLINWRVSGI